jgi:hypothetical protein
MHAGDACKDFTQHTRVHTNEHLSNHAIVAM